ncbi:hypothetical protein B0E50_10120 [Rhodanobacter sp. C01]|nr:hypothetical protein B0E50_10120 [Rhodanobacter sp. C01]
MYIIAGAYGQYDTLRVTDETAHDAPALLRLQAFKPIDVERMKVFQEQILSELQKEKPHSDLCNLLLDLGPPRYYPRYMVQHGMDAFLKPKASDLAPNFDSASHWLVVMKDYLKCDVVVQKP